MKEGQPEWILKGKIPIIWVIDDFNTLLASACISGSLLFDSGQGLDRLRQLVDRTHASFSINFIIKPEYARAGLSWQKELEITMLSPKMEPYHDELQEWLNVLGDRCEVTVHGWSHRMSSYSAALLSNPDWQYTKRSEWLYNPNPVGNYRRCLEALRELGYQPIQHAFSNCGGRMDYGTFRKLRKSKFGVLTKFPTMAEVCKIDYPGIPEMPWYIPDLDAFVLPWGLGWNNDEDDFICLFNSHKPIFLVNHGYEFCDPWFNEMRSYQALYNFVRDYGNDLVFIRYGDYVKIIYDSISNKYNGNRRGRRKWAVQR